MSKCGKINLVVVWQTPLIIINFIRDRMNNINPVNISIFLLRTSIQKVYLHRPPLCVVPKDNLRNYYAALG